MLVSQGVKMPTETAFLVLSTYFFEGADNAAEARPAVWAGKPTFCGFFVKWYIRRLTQPEFCICVLNQCPEVLGAKAYLTPIYLRQGVVMGAKVILTSGRSFGERWWGTGSVFPVLFSGLTTVCQKVKFLPPLCQHLPTFFLLWYVW